MKGWMDIVIWPGWLGSLREMVRNIFSVSSLNFSSPSLLEKNDNDNYISNAEILVICNSPILFRVLWMVPVYALNAVSIKYYVLNFVKSYDIKISYSLIGPAPLCEIKYFLPY